jgi:hypothetical protein
MANWNSFFNDFWNQGNANLAAGAQRLGISQPAGMPGMNNRAPQMQSIPMGNLGSMGTNNVQASRQAAVYPGGRVAQAALPAGQTQLPGGRVVGGNQPTIYPGGSTGTPTPMTDQGYLQKVAALQSQVGPGSIFLQPGQELTRGSGPDDPLNVMWLLTGEGDVSKAQELMGKPVLNADGTMTQPMTMSQALEQLFPGGYDKDRAAAYDVAHQAKLNRYGQHLAAINQR